MRGIGGLGGAKTTCSSLPLSIQPDMSLLSKPPVGPQAGCGWTGDRGTKPSCLSEASRTRSWTQQTRFYTSRGRRGQNKTKGKDKTRKTDRTITTGEKGQNISRTGVRTGRDHKTNDGKTTGQNWTWGTARTRHGQGQKSRECKDMKARDRTQKDRTSTK